MLRCRCDGLVAEVTTDRYRYAAITVALIIGGALVCFGLLDGNAWVSLAGGVLTGGTGVVAVKK